MSGPEEPKAPLLRVVRGGEPTAEELAALVTAVATAIAATGRQESLPSRWSAREPQLRRPLHPGPGAWKASATR